jgi:hypothetical protein
MTTTAEGASRALVNMSGHHKLANPMKDDVFLCLCAGQQNPAQRRHLLSLAKSPPPLFPSHAFGRETASLQEFLVRAADSKMKKENGDSLMGCAKVCDNVSAMAVDFAA